MNTMTLSVVVALKGVSVDTSRLKVAWAITKLRFTRTLLAFVMKRHLRWEIKQREAPRTKARKEQDGEL